MTPPSLRVRALRSGALGAFLLAACATSDTTGRAPTSDSLAGEYLKGRFAAGQRDLTEAADAFAGAARRSDEGEITAQAFQYALATGEIEEAGRFARAIEAIEGSAGRAGKPVGAFVEDELPRLALAAVAIEDEDWDEANRLLSSSYSSGIGRSLGFLLQGWALYGEEGLGRAADHLRDVPDDTFGGFVPLHMALMLDASDQADAAETAYAAATQTPAADTALIAFAGLLEREGKDDEALRLYRRMSEDQGFVRRVGRMGLARLGEPAPGEAEAFLKSARKAPRRQVETAQDGAALALLNFAWAAYEQAVSEQAAAQRAGFGDLDLYLNAPLSFAQLALYLDDDLDAARYVIGSITALYGQPALSVEANSGVGSSSWLYNFAVIDRATALVALDREGEAIVLLEQYLKQDALAPEVHLRLSDLYAQGGRDADAAREATEAIEAAAKLSSDETRADNLWRYYFARGAYYSDAGEWALAEADLKEALRLAPDQAGILNFLGYSYVERGENVEEALAMIERALTLMPSSGAITDSLGWAYYQLGRYEDAVRTLERAVALSPGDDVITDHLGDAYWQAGRRTEAAYEWRRVLEIEELEADLRASVEAKLAGRAPEPGAMADGDA